MSGIPKYRPPKSGPTYMSLVVRSQIGPWLKRIRRFHGWTMREAAAKADVSLSVFGRAELNQVISAKNWIALSAFVQANWPKIIQ